MTSARESSGYSCYDVVVVGSGPNGLAAAITVLRAGYSVLVVEGRKEIGGGMRSEELTLPGYVHDVCSAIHPLGVGSPFFRSVPLTDLGVQWIQPPVPVANPLDGGSAVSLHRSLDRTAWDLGEDVTAYRTLMQPLADVWEGLVVDLLAPPLRIPRHPFPLARFGLLGLQSVQRLAEQRFGGVGARALLAGLAAHSMLPLDRVPTAALGLILGVLGHTVGWPLPRGGSRSLTEALATYVRSLGGEILTGVPVERLVDLPDARVILLDMTPRQVLRLAGDTLPHFYRSQLERYRYGPGAFKLDWALAGPIPWQAAGVSQAGTVHVGGTLEEVASAESAVGQGRNPDRPFVLLAQQSLFDETRAPPGKHTGWAYCHVPNGSPVDMTERIEAQVERFAPGFRDLILARHVMAPADFERYNPNDIGGDINGGAMTLWQTIFRPAVRLVPYTTPNPRLFLCSASTPPGGGVHGMCGAFAARAALRRLRRGFR